MASLPSTNLVVILTFDQTTQKRIERVTSDLEAVGLAPFPPGSRVIPHITLAAFSWPAAANPHSPTPPDGLESGLSDLAAATAPVRVRLSALSSFGASPGVVYLAPTPSQELLQVQARLRGLLQRLNLPLEEFYRPGQWTPHCTLGVNLPADSLPRVYQTCLAVEAFGPGWLEELQMVVYPPPSSLRRYSLGNNRPDPGAL